MNHIVLDIVKQGGYVFPCVKDSKKPAIEDFAHNASRDLKKLKTWEGRFNLGLFTGKFLEGKALLAIDVDAAKGGFETLAELKKKYNFPDTYTQKTPSGGVHMIYWCDHPFRQGVDVLGPGVDIRSKGGYVILSGSTFQGKPYLYDRSSPVGIAKIPEHNFGLSDRLFEFDSPMKDPIEAHIVVNKDAAVERAEHYLKHEAPIAVEGQGGDQTTYRVACEIKDMGVDELAALQLLSMYWNPRCSPPWDEEGLTNKVRNAYQYGLFPPGAKAPENVFSIEEKKEKSYLDKINENHALVFIEGKHAILCETEDYHGDKKVDFLTEHTFKRKFSPFKVQGVKGRARNYAEIWLDWEKRRTYKGVHFYPEKKVEGYFNLWFGFTCEPTPYLSASKDAKHGFDMFMEHLRVNVADSNEEHLHWIVSYFAHLIQRPYEKPTTSLVFKGRKGTGKNAMLDRVGSLFAHHYKTAHDSRYLTSNFNSHLEDCLMVVLDEAFWSGDKSAEGKLKGLITSPKLLIERKGMESYIADNFTRVVIVGNEDWLVPASHDERRYAVFEVGNSRQQDTKFFHDMRICMDELGGNEVLLHYLKNYDIRGVDINTAPKTKALLEQQSSSLDGFDRYWLECLQAGKLLGYESFDSDTVDWPDVISKEDFRNCLDKYMDRTRMRGWRYDMRVVTKKLLTVCPSVVLRKLNKDKSRVPSYCLPSLEEARKHWNRHVKHEVDWEAEYADIMD